MRLAAGGAPRRRSVHLVTRRGAVLALAVAASCGDGAAPDDATTLEKVSGDEQSSFAGAPLPLPVEVRVRDRAGDPVAGVLVAWSVAEGQGSITPALVSTNALGIASATWTLGSDRGTYEATAAVPGVDPERFAASTIPSASCHAAPHALEIGELLALDGMAAAELCVAGDGGEYVAIAHNAGPPGQTVHLQAMGTLVVEAAAVADTRPAVSRALPSVRRDERFHAGVQRRARTLWSFGSSEPAGPYRAQAGTAPIPRASITNIDPHVGDLVAINAQTRADCTSPIDTEGRIAAVSARAIVVHDLENPAGFTNADYGSLALTFDTLIHPVAAANFGEPLDTDGNGRVVLYYTAEVNKLTDRGSGRYVAGQFLARDLLPRSFVSGGFPECPTSNEGEILYLLAADAAGEVGDPRDTAFVRRVTLAALAHEYQHLISASRRMLIHDARFEEVWLDEGLSGIAEELTFRASSGLAAGSNIDLDDVEAGGAVEAFEVFGIGNIARFASFLSLPFGHSPYDFGDASGTRGAAWHFLRYAADRRGGDEHELWLSLVNSRLTGIVNLEAVLGPSGPWLRDWAAAVLFDDLIPVPATLSFPSWNLRSVFTGPSGGGAAWFSGANYDVAFTDLSDGMPESMRLVAGGASYLRLTIAPGLAGAMQIRADGAAPDGNVTVTLVRMQ